VARGQVGQSREGLRREFEWVSTHVRTQHARARVIGLAAGLDRLAAFVGGRQRRALGRALARWDMHTQYVRSVGLARRMLRLLAAERVVTSCVRIRDRRLREAFRSLRLHMLVTRKTEQGSCAVELQRAARGFVARRRVRRLRGDIAATTIQRYIRGSLCRRRVWREWEGRKGRWRTRVSTQLVSYSELPMHHAFLGMQGAHKPLTLCLCCVGWAGGAVGQRADTACGSGVPGAATGGPACGHVEEGEGGCADPVRCQGGPGAGLEGGGSVGEEEADGRAARAEGWKGLCGEWAAVVGG
jgi:hypothetical protein